MFIFSLKNRINKACRGMVCVGGKKSLLTFITIGILCLTVLSSVIRYEKYKNKDIDYINSDATWHVLLTVECYNQTPIDDHIFLPIVSLGKPSDKWISWGATVPDKKGNYYYTSFSPAGYVAPWAFFKLFNLETKESNLFIFSSVIYCLSVSSPSPQKVKNSTPMV